MPFGRKVLSGEELAAGTRYQPKGGSGSLRMRGDGASDVEALFASQEDAKPPTILAAGAGYN
ncbi:hypothetical protein BW898_23680 [Bacillus cereus]|nr:hypothetical protein BW898_23680 [Bacillus cereus]